MIVLDLKCRIKKQNARRSYDKVDTQGWLTLLTKLLQPLIIGPYLGIKEPQTKLCIDYIVMVS